MEEPRKYRDWARISVLGSGGFGTVFLWRSETTNESIAVKRCKLQCSTSLTNRQKERWQNEVNIIKELNHRNIIKHKPLPEFLEDELNKFNPTKLPLLSMEYCHRGNLRRLISLPTKLRGLKEDVVREILMDITSAVQYLHGRQISHRDIKPENIVIDDCPDRESNTIYKLIDLGYAKEWGRSPVSFVGTLYYLAPEIYICKKYDHTVDYWSLGILTFEIVCGCRPFPSSLSLLDRYRVIEKKGKDDICLYQNHLGNFYYGSELFRENYISSCLKRHLEIWLRKALAFNPSDRSEPFPNSLNIFEQMKTVLKKKIVNVFSVHNFDFFSYEFDECTRYSTLKQWIFRDTKIPEEEQLLLGTMRFHTADDNTLLADCFVEGTYNVFVFRRVPPLFNEDKPYIPKWVKVMFERSLEIFTWAEIKTMYVDSIYLLSRDIIYAAWFANSMESYIGYLRYRVNWVQKNGSNLRLRIEEVLSQVVKINKLVEVVGTDFKQKEKFETFFAKIEMYVKVENDLAMNIKKWDLKVEAIQNMYSQLNIIRLPKVQELFKKSVQLLYVTSEEPDKYHMKVGEMPKIVSEAMKLKNKLLTDNNLLEFVAYLNKATKHLDCLLSWMNTFTQYVGEMEIYATSLLSSIVPKSQERLTLHYRTIEQLLAKSEGLNLRTSEELEECLSKHENFVRYIEGCLQEISEEPV